jgi:hypothetical protein
MLSLRIHSSLALALLYSAAALFVAIAPSASTRTSFPAAVNPSHSVDHFHKGDRLTASKTLDGAGFSISVQMSGRSDVLVHDRKGNIIFAVDNAAHLTIIAKQSGRSVSSLKVAPPIGERHETT